MAGKRPKYKKPATGTGKKETVYIHADNLKIWRMLENRSAFINLCLEDAVGMMQWAIMKQRDPKRYNDDHRPPIEEVAPEFNTMFPADPLTQARRNKQKGLPPSQLNSPNIQDLL